VITPNPKTSGGARWNYLAAWGYALQKTWRRRGQGGGFVTRSTRMCRCSIRARAARPPLRRARLGDVLIAWENEAGSGAQAIRRGQVRDRLSVDKHPGRTAGRGGGQDRRQARHPRRARRPTSNSSTRRKGRRSRARISTGRATTTVGEVCEPVPEAAAAHDRQGRFGGWKRRSRSSSPTAACSTRSISREVSATLEADGDARLRNARTCCRDSG
jgi:hypothetical protein